MRTLPDYSYCRRRFVFMPYQVFRVAIATLFVIVALAPSASGRSTQSNSDPELTYSTYLGGDGRDAATDVAVAPDGSIFIAGTTTSAVFPAANGNQNQDPNPECCNDVFVAKLDPAGERVEFVVLVGGSDHDNSRGIAVGNDGSAYVVGNTRSADFPTKNAFQGKNAGCPGRDAGCALDGFLTRVSGDGDIIYSTYVGGRRFEDVNDVAVDSTGSAYLVGHSSSKDYPVQRAGGKRLKGATDFVLTAVSSEGSLKRSRFLGGRAAETYPSIAIAPGGSLFVGGTTRSSNYPAKNGFDARLGGPSDAVLTELSRTFRRVLRSSFVGGSDLEGTNSVAVTHDGAVIAGSTSSNNFPRKGARRGYEGGCCDAFITAFSARGSGLRFSLLLGGGDYDEAWGLAANSKGIYVVGATQSSDFPVNGAFDERTAMECQTSATNCYEAFAAMVGSRGELHYSSYLGGSRFDFGRNVTVAGGSVFLTGETESADFPTRSGVQNALYGTSDAFVSVVTTTP